VDPRPPCRHCGQVSFRKIQRRGKDGETLLLLKGEAETEVLRGADEVLIETEILQL